VPLVAVLIVGTLRIARLQVPPFSRTWWPFPGRWRVVGVRPGPSGRSARSTRAGSLHLTGSRRVRAGHNSDAMRPEPQATLRCTL
jgi:hypothetical protein